VLVKVKLVVISLTAGELYRSPFASLRENAGLSRCPFPPLRYGRTSNIRDTSHLFDKMGAIL